MQLSRPFITALVALSLTASCGMAQQLSRPEAVSAYIYSLARNVEWPEDAGIAEYGIHIISADNTAIREMRGAMTSHKLNGRPVRVTHGAAADVPEGTHIVYLGRDRDALLPAVYDGIEGRPVLLITDNGTDRRLTMINLLDAAGGRMRFEMNKANILNQHLRVMQDVILLGGTEIDVAELYREGQQSLRSLQQQLETMEGNVHGLEAAIADNTRVMQVQSDSLAGMTGRIRDQQEVLDMQTEELQRRDAALQGVRRQIREQEVHFSDRLREFELLSRELALGRDTLRDLEERALHQREALDTLATALEQQGVVIDRQKGQVTLLLIIMALAGLLSAAVFYAYRQKRRATRDLARLVDERTNELQVANSRLTVELAERRRAEQELERYQKRLEEMVQERTMELRDANERLGAIFDAANVGIVFLRDRIIEQCNTRLEEIFGYGPDEMIGCSTRIWYEDDAAFAVGGEPAFEQMRRREVHQREQQLVRRDGGRFWARLSGTALDANDLSKGTVGVIEDVTQERAYEDSLREALEAAKAADQLKSAFLATMSHELRTPLNSIIGFTGILLKGIAGPLNAEQSKQLGMAKGSAHHLLALINDVLDISKIEAGQLVVTIAPFDFRALMERTLASVKPLAEKKNLDLHLQLSDSVGSIISDERRVGQIMLNLINNAIKFTDSGSVIVSADADERGIDVAVRDTGIGMRPEDLDRLFRPFTQIDTGISRNHEGTGLGLSISQRLAEKLGGSISVESAPGLGSTFTVTLPLDGTSINESPT